MPYATPITREHLKARVELDENGCWIWQLSKDRHGYGLLAPGAQERLAHRLSYHLFVGEIPEGLTVDHLCFVTNCVNPEHLRLLTVSENSRNQRPRPRTGPGGRQRTHCLRGHEFTPENTLVWTKQRLCRTCRKASQSRPRA